MRRRTVAIALVTAFVLAILGVMGGSLIIEEGLWPFYLVGALALFIVSAEMKRRGRRRP